jgi:protein disulfide-isomerase
MKIITTLFAVAAMTAGTALADESWLTNIEKAQAIAKKEGKMVLVDFTGSDWCPPCKALHSKVLATKEFKKYAKDNLVLVEIDFPRRKQISKEQKAYNQAQAKKYGLRGVPMVLVFDAKGKQIHKEVGFRGQSPAAYINKLKSLDKPGT